MEFLMKKIFVIALLFAFAITGFAQLDRSKRPEAGVSPKVNIANFESFTLDNGLKVIVVQDKKVPVVSIELLVARDPVVEGDAAGLLSVFGELWRTGTTTKNKQQLDKEIDALGATLSTNSYGMYASSLKKHTPKLLEIVSDLLMNPTFPETEMAPIIDRTKSGILSQQDSPGFIAGLVASEVIFGTGHPYAENATASSVSKVSREGIVTFYKSYVKPNISFLAIVGDITVGEAKKYANAYFGKWQKGEVPQHTYKAPETPFVNKVSVVDRPNAVQSNIIIGHPVKLELSSPDYFSALVMNTMLGGGVFRLFDNLREKHAYTYGAYSELKADDVAGSFRASADVKKEVTDSAITQFLFEMKRIRTEKATDVELQKVKNYLIGTFALSLENPQTIASFAINIDRYGLPKDFYANYLKNISAVTTEEVMTAAKKYVNVDKTNIVIVGAIAEFADKLKRFSAAPIDYYDKDGSKVDPNALKVPSGVTAEGVINDYVAAVGGKEKLLGIVDVTISMEATVQGMKLEMTSYTKAPNKYLMVTKVMGMEQKAIYDGTRGVQVSPQGTQDIPAADLDLMKFESDPAALTRWSNYAKAELKSMEKVNGSDAYKVEFSFPGGSKSSYFFDASTKLLVRTVKSMETEQGAMEQSMDYTDYRDVSGVKFSFLNTMQVMGMTLEGKVKEVKLNSGLADSLFLIP